MVIKSKRKDALQTVLHAEIELLMELDTYILKAKAMGSPTQYTLKRTRAEVVKIFAPLHKEFENTLT